MIRLPLSTFGHGCVKPQTGRIIELVVELNPAPIGDVIVLTLNRPHGWAPVTGHWAGRHPTGHEGLLSGYKLPMG